MTSRANVEWLSAHISFVGVIHARECDRLITGFVAPFVAKCTTRRWIDRYFFVRYSEGGPHVRLRLQGERTVVTELVRPALVRRVAGERAAAHRPTLALRSTPGLDAPVGLKWVPYEPEVERYGGPQGVHVAERFFHFSSEACINLLREVEPDDRGSKLGKTLLAMIVLLHTFCGDRQSAVDFCSQYGTSYLRGVAREEEQQSMLLDAFGAGYRRQSETLVAYVDEAWERLATGAPLSDTLERYARDVREIRSDLGVLAHAGQLVRGGRVLTSWKRAVFLIVPSYMHMTSNRLGVTLPEESYLAYLIRQALGRCGASASSAGHGQHGE